MTKYKKGYNLNYGKSYGKSKTKTIKSESSTT